MEETVINFPDSMDVYIKNWENISELIGETNYSLKFIANQIYVLEIGLLVAFCSYFIYRLLKRFI